MSLIKVDSVKLDNIKKEERIRELKKLLSDTDYIALSDYDKEQTELKLQRKEWREEIRSLENN
jgi:hypothetical protein